MHKAVHVPQIPVGAGSKRATWLRAPPAMRTDAVYCSTLVSRFAARCISWVCSIGNSLNLYGAGVRRCRYNMSTYVHVWRHVA